MPGTQATEKSSDFMSKWHAISEGAVSFFGVITLVATDAEEIIRNYKIYPAVIRGLSWPSILIGGLMASIAGYGSLICQDMLNHANEEAATFEKYDYAEEVVTKLFRELKDNANADLSDNAEESKSAPLLTHRNRLNSDTLDTIEQNTALSIAHEKEEEAKAQKENKLTAKQYAALAGYAFSHTVGMAGDILAFGLFLEPEMDFLKWQLPIQAAGLIIGIVGAGAEIRNAKTSLANLGVFRKKQAITQSRTPSPFLAESGDSSVSLSDEPSAHYIQMSTR